MARERAETKKNEERIKSELRRLENVFIII